MIQRPDLSLTGGGVRVGLPTERATALQVATGPRGLESVTATIPLSTYQAFDLYTRLGGLVAGVTVAGQRVARGRVEDVTLTDQGVQLAALGAWRELSDVPYTALWSASGVPGWFPTSAAANPVTLADRIPAMYVIEQSEYIAIQLTKGASYGNLADVGGVGFRVPSASERQIVGLQFRAQTLLPNDWRLQVNTYSDDLFTTVTSVPLIVTSAGALLDRAYHVAFAGAGAIEIYIFNNTGGASAPAGETGDWYTVLSDIRVVTSTANRVNTTLAANRAAGTSVAATVASTAGMYAGMQLVVNSGAATSEIITVQNVTSATQFVATFVGSYTSGQAVQGHKVRADEVPTSLLSYTTGINTGVLSASTARIEPCDRDLLNAAWEDAAPADIIGDLAERGDGTQRFEAGTGTDGLLYFRPAGSAAQTWYVDAADLQVTQTLNGLVNSVYGRYQAEDGRTLRTAAQTDALSVRRYGLTRRGAVDANTTSNTIAEQVAQTARDETSDPVPQAALTVRRIFTEGGTLAPLWLVQAGDTVIIRNLPPAAGAAARRIQMFRLAATTWDALAGTLSLTPESPQPTYESQVAVVQAAAEVAASVSETPASLPITVLPPQQNRRRNPPRAEPVRN